MPEVSQVIYTHKELASLMVRDQGIRSGLWMVYARFANSVSYIAPPEDQDGPAGPGVVTMLVDLGIQRADQSGPLTVDASQVWKEESKHAPAKAR